MKFKVGIGLLLFGIIISNGVPFDTGSYLFLASVLIGAVGLALIILGSSDSGDSSNNGDKEE